MQYLVISALGADRPGIVDSLSKAVLTSGCNVVDSRMTVLGGEFAVILMASGSWDAVARLETALPALQERLSLTVTAKRTAPQEAGPARVAYSVEVVAMDHPGIVHWLASFFSSRNINIFEMSTNSYAAAHTGTPMFSVHMIVHIPAGTHIGELRDEFMDLCDELNLDAVMEAVKA